MEKDNIIDILVSISNDTKNSIIASQAYNYACTLEDMTQETYQQAKSFYLEFIIKYFNIIK